MKQISEATGETVDLAVLEGNRMRFIDQVIGSQRLRTVSSIGESFPLTTTATGKAALATFEPTEATKLIISEFEARPELARAVILMLLFAFYLPLFPIAGRISDIYEIERTTGFLTIDTLLVGNFAAFLDAIHHLILPAIALSLSGIGQAARLTRANMVETYEKPYIEMAQAYGFFPSRIARTYAFKPSLIPSLTIIGLDFAAMLGNAFLVEAVFAWPGLSRYGVAVILRKDLNAIMGTVLIIAITFLIVNIIVDLMIAFINPRIRYSTRGTA